MDRHGCDGRLDVRAPGGRGYPLTVYSRTRARAQPLLDRGASWADTPAEVAAVADVTFTIVGYPADVREVVLGENGVLTAAMAGSVLVDMSTSEPSLAKEIFEAAATKRVGSVDAPVSGGDVGARNATLSIMVGGEAATFERVRPLLEILGTTVSHQGPAGAGQHTKMVEPDTDRDRHDRCVRGIAVCPPGRTRPREGAGGGERWSGRVVVAVQLRATDAEG